ncbi:hypothetical protein KKE26_01075 [bacterium]|nr:hypothetical protein [bacterium]MBU1754303.1 hypothetical protein [bacterium]
MNVRYTRLFLKQYGKLPDRIQEEFDEKLGLLLGDLHYPSLRTKKIKSHANIWEASVTMDYRFTFKIEEEVLILRKIGTHNILQNP